MKRELNLYFTAMSAREALLLVLGGLWTCLTGNHGSGRWASRLEESWPPYGKDAEAVVFPSARSGLYALLKALGTGPGDEVIITGFTCTAVAVPILECGAIPVYADINPLTYNMAPKSVEQLIGPRTKVLVVQHTFGIPAAVPELVALARERGLYVIEDACLALGSRYQEKPLGSFGDAALFSFELSKTLSAGWGGLVQTNIPGLGESLRSARQKAALLSRMEAARRLGQAGLSYFLYHPNTLQISKYPLAALFKLGLFRYSTPPEELKGRFNGDALSQPADTHWQVIVGQLGRLKEILDRSHQVAERYREVLSKHSWPGESVAEKDSEVQLIRFPLLVQDRDRMTHYFAREGIELGRWFSFPISPRPPDLATFNYSPGQCPVSEEVSQHIVNLPLHPRLSQADVDRICWTLDRYLAEHPPDRDSLARFLAVHV